MKQKIFKKHGCLIKGLITLGVIIVIVVVGLFSIKDSLEILGLKFETFQKYMKLINQEVNETELVSNKISNTDYLSFKLNAQDCGFDVFGPTGDINISKGVIDLGKTINIPQNELGAFMQQSISSKNLEDKENFDLLSLTITPTGNQNIYNFKTITKLDLSKAKAELGNNGKDFPSFLYLTTSTSCGIVGNRVTEFGSQVVLNQLSADDNKAILSFIEEVFSTKSDKFEFKNLVNKYIFEILEEISLKSHADLILATNQLTLMKVV